MDADYPDEPEGPDEINPAFLAEGKRAEVLLRNPESWTEDDKGNRTFIVPEGKWLEWSEVPLIENVWNCRHGYSICAECADSWGQDYFIRFWSDDKVVWLSPDHPDHPDYQPRDE